MGGSKGGGGGVDQMGGKGKVAVNGSDEEKGELETEREERRNGVWTDLARQ